MTLKQLEDLLSELRKNSLVNNNTELFTVDSYDQLFPLVLYDVDIKEVRDNEFVVVMKEEFT